MTPTCIPRDSSSTSTSGLGNRPSSIILYSRIQVVANKKNWRQPSIGVSITDACMRRENECEWSVARVQYVQSESTRGLEQRNLRSLAGPSEGQRQ